MTKKGTEEEDNDLKVAVEVKKNVISSCMAPTCVERPGQVGPRW